MNTLPTWFIYFGTSVVYLLGVVPILILAYLGFVRWAESPRRIALVEPTVIDCPNCRFCGMPITDGETQLEVWRSYGRHVAEAHQ